MKIVIDTNVFISAVFFGGLPLKVLHSIISKQNDAYISPQIWDEYNDVIERLTKKYPSRLKHQLIDEVFKVFKVISPSTAISICRDPDDDKFVTAPLGEPRGVHGVSMALFLLHGCHASQVRRRTVVHRGHLQRLHFTGVPG